MFDDLELSSIPDERSRALSGQLLKVIETVTADLRTAQAEIQRLRAEINRRTGDQGRPPTPPNPPPPAPPDHASEQERRTRRERGTRAKQAHLPIAREQIRPVAPALLPPAAEFKGDEAVVVQAVRLQTDNVRVQNAKYYARRPGQSYVAPLPAGAAGHCGPGITALTLVLYYACQLRESKIREFLQHVGVQRSDGTISNLRVKAQGALHAEQAAAYVAGLRRSPGQHLDDTATRVKGQNQPGQIVGTPLPPTYRPTPAKDRLPILDVLRTGPPRTFLLDDDALAYLDALGISQLRRHQVRHLPRTQRLDEATLLRLLEEHLPGLGSQTRKWILEARAVSADHAPNEGPVVRLLLCDDAPQFQWVTDEVAVCWVHAGRHDNKLTPWIALHQPHLDDFLQKVWAYYHDLRRYQEHPRAEDRARLKTAFDTLFATRTGSWALDARITLTRAKQAPVLTVLAHPEVPLHNTPAELAARQRAGTPWVKRDVSFGPRPAAGATAGDTLMSLAATTKKLGLSFYHAIHDRISGAHQVPTLAAIIDARAHELTVGAAWGTT